MVGTGARSSISLHDETATARMVLVNVHFRFPVINFLFFAASCIAAQLLIVIACDGADGYCCCIFECYPPQLHKSDHIPKSAHFCIVSHIPSDVFLQLAVHYSQQRSSSCQDIICLCTRSGAQNGAKSCTTKPQTRCLLSQHQPFKQPAAHPAPAQHSSILSVRCLRHRLPHLSLRTPA
jgi:hypothetical protein